jgi:hypothetical protein
MARALHRNPTPARRRRFENRPALGREGEEEMQRAGKLVYLAAAMVAAAPGLAGAQGWQPVGSENLLTPFGEYVLIGGGVTQFTDSDVKDAVDVGGAWDVRVGVGSRYFLGVEAAYVGSFRGGKNGANDLMTNGAEGILRVQYPYVRQGWLVEPFAFGGVGWNRLSVRDAPPGIEDSDDIGVVPFGAGVTLGRGKLLFDARFTYRTSFAEDLAVAASGAKASFDNWAVNASIGAEF